MSVSQQACVVRRAARLGAVGLTLALAACAAQGPTRSQGDGRVHYQPASFETLPGWADDQPREATTALLRSCARLRTLPASSPVGPAVLGSRAGDWGPPCAALEQASRTGTVREALVRSFQPWQVIGPDGPEGLFTGYYEATLDVSFTPSAVYATPVYGQPPGWTETSGVTRPDRAAIEDGALAGIAPVLMWARDPVDVFFLHIQGSGVARLPDGRSQRIGFAGSNGHPFVGIGALMRKRGLGDGSSMTAIRTWLRANPAEGRALMRENPRYIFFRTVEGEGPIGAQGVALSAGRSLAVDRDHIPLGAPVWVATSDAQGRTVARLMVAQDTGAAIKGAVRGDVFWGTGEEALVHAGGMRSPGFLWVLLPRGAVVAQSASGTQG
ncbi:Murein degrading transglycosylase protein [Pararhodospirillum photometricum DSM 122]|uniref:peptidoglycan lytic exotransglycosylase n=1 Tax=Pararhodospirillum photometricum DSM 122 TaxID=1150469 RepID=H6SML0_PARPM|nr:Murein degrading transglycosylase protein [Pararhodospirillum photometricum DSM 122]